MRPKHRTRQPAPAAPAVGIGLPPDVKSKIHPRLAGERLDETRRAGRATKHLGRARYRRAAGAAEGAEAK